MLIKRYKRGDEYRALMRCDYCGKEYDINAGNINKSKSCGCQTKQLISDSLRQHGAYSKYEQNEDLYRLIKTVEFMNQRVRSMRWPTYHSICDGLNVDVSGRVEPAKFLLNEFGPKPQGYSIDKVKGTTYYRCGKCEQCKRNGWSSNLVGFIPIRDQRLTRKNVTVFELNDERFSFNELSEHIPYTQPRLNYLWYSKLGDIHDKKQRFDELRKLIFDSSCTACNELTLAN